MKESGRRKWIVGSNNTRSELEGKVGPGETTVQKGTCRKLSMEIRIDEINLISDSFHSLAKKLMNSDYKRLPEVSDISQACGDPAEVQLCPGKFYDGHECGPSSSTGCPPSRLLRFQLGPATFLWFNGLLLKHSTPFWFTYQQNSFLCSVSGLQHTFLIYHSRTHLCKLHLRPLKNCTHLSLTCSIFPRASWPYGIHS